MKSKDNWASLSLLDVEDVPVLVELELLLGEGSLRGVAGFEDLVELLEGASLGFGDEKVDHDSLESAPDNEDDVGLPANLLEGDGPGKLVKETGGVDSERGEGHTLGTHLVREDFDGVESLERSPANRVEHAEHEDEANGTTGSSDVASVEVDTSGDSDGNPDKGERGVGEEEERATAEPVNLGGTADGKEALNEGKTKVDVEDLDGVGDTGGGEETSQEVGDDTVTSPLSEDGDNNVAGDTDDGVTVAEEGRVIPEALVGTVGVVALQELLHLEGNVDGVGVAVAVVLGKDGASLLLTTVNAEPARRLGKEEDGKENAAREESLEGSGDNPLVGVGIGKVERTTGDTGSENGTSEPEAVVETSQGTTVERVSNFNDVGGTSRGSDRDTETEEEATAQELGKRVVGDSGGLDDCSQSDNGAANEHTDPTAPGIDTRTNEGKSDDTTNLVHGGDVGSLDTEDIGVKVVLVGRHSEEGTLEGTIVTVHGGAEESNQAAEVEGEGSTAPWLRSFLSQSCGESLTSLNNLLLRNLLAHGVELMLMLSSAEILFGRHVDKLGPEAGSDIYPSCRGY